jgi:hypothetical protein
MDMKEADLQEISNLVLLAARIHVERHSRLSAQTGDWTVSKDELPQPIHPTRIARGLLKMILELVRTANASAIEVIGTVLEPAWFGALLVHLNDATTTSILILVGSSLFIALEDIRS